MLSLKVWHELKTAWQSSLGTLVDISYHKVIRFDVGNGTDCNLTKDEDDYAVKPLHVFEVND